MLLPGNTARAVFERVVAWVVFNLFVNRAFECSYFNLIRDTLRQTKGNLAKLAAEQELFSYPIGGAGFKV